MSAADSERVKLTPEQLDALMPAGEQVHTIMQAVVVPGTILIGADWDRADILEAARKYGAELSGPEATAMKHGAVIMDPKNPVFIETRPDALPQ